MSDERHWPYIRTQGPTASQHAFLLRATPEQHRAFLLSGPVQVAVIDQLDRTGQPERLYQAAIHGVPVGVPSTFAEDAYGLGCHLQQHLRANGNEPDPLDLDALDLRAAETPNLPWPWAPAPPTTTPKQGRAVSPTTDPLPGGPPYPPALDRALKLSRQALASQDPVSGSALHTVVQTIEFEWSRLGEHAPPDFVAALVERLGEHRQRPAAGPGTVTGEHP